MRDHAREIGPFALLYFSYVAGPTPCERLHSGPLRE